MKKEYYVHIDTDEVIEGSTYNMLDSVWKSYYVYYGEFETIEDVKAKQADENYCRLFDC